MLEFNDNKPIYRQIVDYAFNCIIEREWPPGQLIPSIRELSATLGVNSRTVLKAFEELQDLGVIEPKRGMGFILHADAAHKVREARRNEFFKVTVPNLMREMKMLEITKEELLKKLNNEF